MFKTSGLEFNSKGMGIGGWRTKIRCKIFIEIGEGATIIL